MGVFSPLSLLSPIAGMVAEKRSGDKEKRRSAESELQASQQQLQRQRNVAADERVRRRRLSQIDPAQQFQMATGRKTLLGQ